MVVISGPELRKRRNGWVPQNSALEQACTIYASDTMHAQIGDLHGPYVRVGKGTKQEQSLKKRDAVEVTESRSFIPANEVVYQADYYKVVRHVIAEDKLSHN